MLIHGKYWNLDFEKHHFMARITYIRRGLKREFRDEIPKGWNNCNTTSRWMRNEIHRRCGVYYSDILRLRRSRSSFRHSTHLIDFFEAVWRVLGNPTPSRGSVPCPARCVATIFPALRASATKTRLFLHLSLMII